MTHIQVDGGPISSGERDESTDFGVAGQPGAIECFGACPFDAFVRVSHAYDARWNDPLCQASRSFAERNGRSFVPLQGPLCSVGASRFRRALTGRKPRIFTRADVPEILNVQPRTGGEAKPYQVRQVRAVVLKYGLAQSLSRAKSDAETDDEA